MSKKLVYGMLLVTLCIVLSVAAGTAAQSQTAELPPLTELGPYGVGVKVLESESGLESLR